MSIDALVAYQNAPVREPTAPRGAAAAAGQSGTIDRKSDLYKQCQEFESLFVKMMLDEMKKSVEKSGLTDGGNAEDIFSDMLYGEYAKAMSQNSDFGLADQAYLQLSGSRSASPAQAAKAYSS